jgi:uncharacterized SAM-binding protein YcdF (DUF218 family)
MITNALLGVLAAFVLAQLAPWGAHDDLATIGSVILGAAGGLVVGWPLRSRILIGIDVLLVGFYLAVTWFPIVAPRTIAWVRVDSLPADTLDAVVVLSATVLPDSALNTIGADRLLSGLELMRAGRARRIITTRLVAKSHGREIASDNDQERLVALASETDKWSVVTGPTTTREEAVLTAQLLLPRGEKRIAVVTSPLHTRRACAVFENVGFTVTCRAALERDHMTNPPAGPQDRLAALRAYIYELAGWVKYRSHGWLTPHPVVTQRVGGSS